MSKKVSISKVASMLGESSYILKMWEEEFTAILEIERDHKNARVYSPENIEMLRKIKHMKDSQLDHETIVQMLAMNGKNEAAAASAAVLDPDAELSAKKNIKVALEEIFSLIEEKGKQDMNILELKMDQLELSLIEQLKKTVKQEFGEQTKTQFQTSKGQFAALHHRLNEQSKAQLSAAKEQMEELQQKLEEQTDLQLSAAKNQFTAIHHKLNEQSKAQMKTAKTHFTALQSKLNDQAKSQQQTSKGQFAALQTKLDEQKEAQFNAVKGQFAALNTKLNEQAKTQLQAAKEQYASLQSKMDEQTKVQLGQFSGLQNKVNEHAKTQLTMSKSQFSALKEKLGEMKEAQLNAAEGHYASLHDKLNVIHDTASSERDMFFEEVKYERELAKQYIEQREQKFLAFVQQQKEKEERADRKYGLSMLKQFMGFAK